MADWEKTIIPLDDAHEILSVFGIGSHFKPYQRWRRDDGFRHVDFEGVLGESPAVLIVDWREWLQDAIEVIQRQLHDLGIEATSALGDEGEAGEFRVNWLSAMIKFVSDDEDDFDEVIVAVNHLISQTACYRKFCSCEGSDGWSYAVLNNVDWQSIEEAAPSTVRLLFV